MSISFNDLWTVYKKSHLIGHAIFGDGKRDTDELKKVGEGYVEAHGEAIGANSSDEAKPIEGTGVDADRQKLEQARQEKEKAAEETASKKTDDAKLFSEKYDALMEKYEALEKKMNAQQQQQRLQYMSYMSRGYTGYADQRRR